MSSEHDSRLPPDDGRDPVGGGETPGQLLARAREARGLSRKAAADALNLPLRTLEALEADDYDTLPPLTFVKGYLRAYAQLLEIDPDRLRQALTRLDLERPATGAQQQPGKKAPSVTGSAHSGAMLRGRQVRAGLLGLTSIAVVVVVAVLAWLWLVEGATDDREAPPVAEETEEPTEDRPPEADIVEPVTPEADPDETVLVPEELASRDQPATDEGPDVDAAEPAPVPAVDLDVETAPEAVAEAEPTPSALVLRLSGTTWLEVRDAEGERLMVGNYSGDEVHRLEGEGPFNLVIGNADAIEVEYQGEAVDLAPHTRGNVARLTIP